MDWLFFIGMAFLIIGSAFQKDNLDKFAWQNIFIYISLILLLISLAQMIIPDIL